MPPPLSAAERANVRLYLGWVDRFRQTDSRLEQALNAVDGDTDAYNIVESILASIAALETDITAAYKRFKAVKVGSIELEGDKELGLLRSEGRRFSGRLASFLGVEIRHDVWSGSGPRSYSSWGGLVPAGDGGGGLPPMG
jgi:hypothetical protein